ncbi:MAG: glycosyltransferase family 4 protein [Bacteroidaceae bacterium]|nr:glycosyltransferase family 4 protein [Bacteroidaceae bacterium]
MKSTKTLLFIRYKKSANIFEGGEQCSQRNFNAYARLLGEENVTTYYIHDETKKRTWKDYLTGVLYFPFHYFFGLTPRRVKEIVRFAQDFDYVHVDRSLFGIIARRLKETGYEGRVVCFFHNVETDYFRAKLPKRNPARHFIVRCADKNDSWCCRFADKVIALNERDARILEARYGRRPDQLVPIAMRDTYLRDAYPEGQTSARPLCLILGSYFPPNNEGIEWFAREVLPAVDIRLQVVGKGMGRLREHYSIPDNVEIVPDAPELLPYFEQADVMVLPIFSGGGMKVKTCESLMYGKNIVATDEAFEGYDVDDSRVGARCNTREEFIAALQSFIDSPRPRFNAYSRSLFLARYSEDVVLDSFRRLLQ